MTEQQRQAYVQVMQVGRGIVADLNHVLLDIKRGATIEELEALLTLYVDRAARRTTRAGQQLWRALNGDAPQDTSLLPLSQYETN